MYFVNNLYEKYGAKLGLELVGGLEGMQRKILVPEVHRPGLSLSGYLKNHAKKRILVFGRVEIEYLRDLKSDLRIKRFEAILSSQTPAVIVARGYRPPKELLAVCEANGVPLFRANSPTMHLLNKLTFFLTEEFAKSISCHGTLVEVYGVGILLQGDSSVGKSEAALGLIARGHRLISDDTVRITCREGNFLEGSGDQLIKHHIEIRGIGIINVARLYGAICVRDSKNIDILVRLELWNEQYFYDRSGLDEKVSEILGIKIPYHILPVKAGRDIVLLLETIALNHSLKGLGYNAAKEFNTNLLEKIAQKSKESNVTFEKKI